MQIAGSCSVAEFPIACLERRCNCRSHNGFLLRRGYELAAGAVSSYLDKGGSVSALVEVEDDFTYDATHVELNVPLILQVEMF